MTALIKVMLIALTVIYPFTVYFAIEAMPSPALLAWLLVPIALLHLYRAAKGQPSGWLWVLVCGTLAVFTWVFQSSIGIKLYPVLINLGMLALFGWSLFQPSTIIERLARLQEPELPPSAIIYTRNVTKVWCLFFVVNGAIAGLSVFASDWFWAVYNGLVSYLMMGSLFALEWVYRQYYRSQQHD